MQPRPRLLHAHRTVQPPNSRALHKNVKVVDFIGLRRKGYSSSAERWFLGLRKRRQTFVVSAASEQQMPLEKGPEEDTSGVEANDSGLETDSNPRRGNPNNLLQRIAFSLSGRHNIFVLYRGSNFNYLHGRLLACLR